MSDSVYRPGIGTRNTGSRVDRSRGVRSLGLKARATWAWAVIALVLSAGLATLTYQVTRQQLVTERERSATSQAYLNARVARNALRSVDPDLAALLSSLEGNTGSVVLVRSRGEWFSGSVGIGPRDLPTSLTDAADAGAAGRRLHRIDGQPFVAIGLALPEVEAAYFELAPMDDIERTLASLARRLTVGAILAATLGGAAGWYASHRVLAPLRRFADASEAIAAGSFETRLPAIADRDLRVLERSFNRMAEAVQERIDRESRFSSDVSHELRAPVAALFSIINIARRHADEPGATSAALDDLEDRVGDLHTLVEELLELARIEAGGAHLRSEPVEPRRLVDALLKRLGRSDLPVAVADSAPGTIGADKRRLAQMLQNLIDNADRYGDGATGIEISGGDGVVRFAVDDCGPGVPEHERSYIFERFARGSAAVESGRGTGLGLSLVVEHAALHGGNVRLEDRPQGGSRFVVELPILEPT